jgi:hypothetical protein
VNRKARKCAPEGEQNGNISLKLKQIPNPQHIPIVSNKFQQHQNKKHC